MQWSTMRSHPTSRSATPSRSSTRLELALPSSSGASTHKRIVASHILDALAPELGRDLGPQLTRRRSK